MHDKDRVMLSTNWYNFVSWARNESDCTIIPQYCKDILSKSNFDILIIPTAIVRGEVSTKLKIKIHKYHKHSTNLSAIENQLKIVRWSDRFPVYVICDNLKDLIADITANLGAYYRVSSYWSRVFQHIYTTEMTAYLILIIFTVSNNFS